MVTQNRKIANAFLHLKHLGWWPKGLLRGGMLAVAFFLFSPSPAFATNTGQFTAELWVKPTSSIASQALLGKSEELRIFTDSSGFVGCQIKATTWQTAATATTNALVLNTWAHVACAYDKANIKVYLNGSQVATVAQTNPPDDTANAFLIGQDSSASTPYSNLTGTVDDFQFYNYALSAKQIIQDMEGDHPSIGGRPNSAIAEWKFDEGQGTTANNSGSAGQTLNGTLTLMSSPATATSGWTQSGKFGKALVFDGTNDNVSVNDNDALTPSAITASAWVKRTAAGRTDLILGKASSTTNFSYALYFGNDDKVYWEISSDGNTSGRLVTTTTSTFTYGTWYHVIGTYDGTSKIYVNGVQQPTTSTGSAASLYNNTANLLIGKEITDTSYYFQGIIDEPKIYNYALTADEVKTEYNHGSSLQLGSAGTNSSYAGGAANQEYCVPGDTSACTAPVGRWDFEEGRDNTCVSGVNDVCDTSGNGNDGAWNGTGSHWTNGKVGKAGNFNGSNDYVSLGTDLYETQNAGTIEAWIKLTATSNAPIFDTSQSDSDTNSMKFFAGADNLQFQHYIGSGANNNLVRVNTTLNNNQWYHVAVTSDGSTWKMYINGADQTLVVDVGSNNGRWFNDLAAGTHQVDIGRFIRTSETLYYQGQIDQVRVFDYARSAAQVAYDYNRGKPVGHWKFDECQGTTAYDSSGNGNNGTLTPGSGGQTAVGTCTGSAGTLWKDGATGKRNASLDFDGTDDKITIGTAITGVQSVAFWVKPATSTDSFMDLDGGTHYITASSGTVSATGFSTPTIYVNGISGGSITGGAWNHVVVTTATAFNSTTSFTLGYKSAATADYLNGQIDDVKIFNYALTAAQVKNEYNGGAVFFGPSTGAP